MFNIGVRAHDFGQGGPEEIAGRLAGYGITSVQLALSKSFPVVGNNPGQLNLSFAKEVRDAFAAQGITIAVLGCYINPIHPDPQARELSLRRFEEHLRFAHDFGCAIVGTETGSRNANCSYHPDNQSEEAFMELVGSVRRLAKSAENYGSIIGIEGVAHHHTMDTYDKLVRLLELIDSDNLQVIYDPVNFFPLDECHRQCELMEEAFARFGDRIVAAHCKDFVINADGLKEGDLPSGEGEFDHTHFLNLLQKHRPGIDVILESTHPGNVQQVMDYVRHAAIA